MLVKYFRKRLIYSGSSNLTWIRTWRNVLCFSALCVIQVRCRKNVEKIICNGLIHKGCFVPGGTTCGKQHHNRNETSLPQNGRLYFFRKSQITNRYKKYLFSQRFVNLSITQIVDKHAKIFFAIPTKRITFARIFVTR